MTDTPHYQAMLEWLFNQTRRGAPRNPARMAALLGALGLPMPPRTVHVVGSNGKGTTAAMIQAGLSAAGQRAGLFVSPHVEDFCERISVDGEQIAQRDVVRMLSAWRTLGLPVAPAFFEWTLALALSHFQQEGVMVAVVEAGIGAAKDATLTLENVAVTVLTSVALEHQAVLGPTLEAIARDKAAAVRPGVPLVTGVGGTALAVVREVCAARGSPLVLDDGTDPLFALPLGVPFPSPARAHNARLAAAALRLLGAHEEAVRAAALSQPLPARREVFEVSGRTVVLDGAHNPAACQALAASLELGFTLLFAALPHKQGEASLAPLAAVASKVFLTDAAGERPSLPTHRHRYVPDPAKALEQALNDVPAGGMLVIAGSFYLAGEVRPLLQELSRAAASPRRARAASRSTG